MKKKIRQIMARLWARYGYGLSEGFQVVCESIFDAMDASTGATEMIQELQRENEALTALLTEQMHKTEEFKALAERYRCGARKSHLGAMRYRKTQRCDAIARALYAQNVKTEHGTLKSTALN